MAPAASDLVVRRADAQDAADRAAAIELAASALGWEKGRPNAEFFHWKHLDNPAGASPMWFAEHEGRLAGFRTFLRWRFRRPDGSVAPAVRAVDTATHPDFQGRGVFTALTMAALDELRDEGVAFVFNTPNDKSRPGYLKMGWAEVGRLAVHVRVASVASARRVARARTAADKWSEPIGCGDPAAVVLADTRAVDELLAAVSPPAAYATVRTADHLLWRYRFGPLWYRAFCPGGRIERGLCVFRVRRRGAAREAAVCELLAPGDDPTVMARLLADVRRYTRADYLLLGGAAPPRRAGFVPMPKLGPVLTWRDVCQHDQPPLEQWRLALGDIELF